MTTTTVEAGSSTEVGGLTTLATQINGAHEAAVSAVGSALAHASLAGDLLIQAKGQVPHGEWLPWLSKNCSGISPRTAQGYMQLARKWPELEKRDDVALLSVRRALAILAQCPDEEVDSKDRLDRGGSEDRGRDGADEAHDEKGGDNAGSDLAGDDEAGRDKADSGVTGQTRVLALYLEVSEYDELKHMIEELKTALGMKSQTKTVAMAIRQAWAINVD